MNKKGNVLLILLIIVAIFGSGYFIANQRFSKVENRKENQLTPTPSNVYNWKSAGTEENNWVSFTDPTGKMTLRHPADWQKGEYAGKFYLVPECSTCGGIRSYVTFTVEKTTENMMSREYVDSYVAPDFEPLYGGENTLKIVENIPDSITEYDVTMVDGFGGAGAPGPNFYIAKEETIVRIESDGLDFIILSKILSTLKLQ